MSPDDPLDPLFAETRTAQRFGAPRGKGFATRLRARLREERDEPGLGDLISRLSWRFTAAALPGLVVAAALLSVSDLTTFPEGFGSVVSHWSLYLSLDLP